MWTHTGPQEIHEKYPHINLALIHLGGTTVPVIRVMVTMDAVQGIKLLVALQPDQAIPIQSVSLSLFFLIRRLMCYFTCAQY